MSQKPPADTTAMSSIASSTNNGKNDKNDIKVSPEGVAKLSFGFLEELQGDSSLEPGEVKTPPHSGSPATLRESAPTIVAKVADAMAKSEMLSKAIKTVSQLEAEACEEKVRAILEIDAKKRREEVERRKLETDKRRRSGELDLDDEKKRKAKEERKRIKRLKKEQEAARLALLSDEDEFGVKQKDDTSKSTVNKRKISKQESDESEGLCSSAESAPPHNDQQMRPVVNSVAVPSMVRYPLAAPLTHLPPPYPDAFMGFRPLNPFMRCSRPDFAHGRGGFLPRGRGGMRGRMPFPGYRPPFYSGGLLRHHAPAHRQHTPPISRGHSPVLPPSASNLIWTKSKPSISYAFSSSRDGDSEQKSEGKESATDAGEKDEVLRKKKLSKKASSSKDKKKSKKIHEREHERKKSKKHGVSRKESKISSKRQIEKIRKSWEQGVHKTLPKILQSDKDSTGKSYNSNVLNVVENIKTEKVESVESEEEGSTLVFKSKLTDSVKVEPAEKAPLRTEPEKIMNKRELKGDVIGMDSTGKESKSAKHLNEFDMFAESPPKLGEEKQRTVVEEGRASEDVKSTQEQNNKKRETFAKDSIDTFVSKEEQTPKRSITQLYLDTNDKTVSKTPLEKAIEIQKRIDKLLQQDDLKTETIEAAKEALLRKSEKHRIYNSQTNYKPKLKEEEKEKSLEKEVDLEKDSVRREQHKEYHNPFKSSTSRDQYYDRTDATRRTDSRERDRKVQRKMSTDKSHLESGGRTQEHSKTRSSGTSSFNRSHSNENDLMGSTDSLPKEGNLKDRSLKECDLSGRSRYLSAKHKSSNTPPPQSHHINLKDKPKCYGKKNVSAEDGSPIRKQSKVSAGEHLKERPKKKSEASSKKLDAKKSKSAPLSFTVAEFLFPEDAGGVIDGDADEDFEEIQTKPSSVVRSEDDDSLSRNFARSSKTYDLYDDKVNSPDTDDYMDNWENEDADIDINSNTACDSSTPIRSSPEYTDDTYVSRFVNPSPPSDLLQSGFGDDKNTTPNATPPIGAAERFRLNANEIPSKRDGEKSHEDRSSKELFGMQEIYDQFIKSVEESGVNIKDRSQKSPMSEVSANGLTPLKPHTDDQQTRSEMILSSSSTSTSSTSSTSSSSSDASNSTSSSSSSSSSSDESNDDEGFQETTEHKLKKTVLPDDLDPPSSIIDDNAFDVPTKSDALQLESEVNASERSAPIENTPPTPPLTVNPAAEQTKLDSKAKTQKSSVAKDFKKLKNLEANLARIQMMLANYDSSDDISEELQKMEKLFLQEKNVILQKYAKSVANKPLAENTQQIRSTTPPIAGGGQFVPSLQQTEVSETATVANEIFNTNREAIKLTISPMKLSKAPAIFDTSIVEESSTDSLGSKPAADAEEVDFTEKLVKPAKEIAIVKPMMESKESRSRDQQQQRRSPIYERDRPRSPIDYRDRSRRSSSRSRLSPQRRGRARSLSASPPRRGGASSRHGSPQRRVGQLSRHRGSSRRSRSRSRSPSRQVNRRSGEFSPTYRRRRSAVQESQAHYKKSMRFIRSSRSRSPRSSRSPKRPHSPRSPPTKPSRRRSYSQERYSRSPLPFKPPSPPMRRSLSPLVSSSRRSCSPHSPRMPHSPRSPPPSRYDEHRRRRGGSYDRHSLSPQRQYYVQESGRSGVSSSSSYYYNVSPNRISLDARINIVLNGPPATAGQDAPGAYESYSAYAQYGGAYMSLPPQPIPNSGGYYANQYVPMSSTGEAQLPPHLHMPQPTYSNIPTISSVSGPPANFYYNEFCGHHQSTSLLKELPKATVAVQKGNVLEIVPSGELPQTPTAHDTPQTKATKVKSTHVSWKEEVNNRHVTAAVMRLSRENEGSSRSILKRLEAVTEVVKEEKPEKKKVYFEDGIFPNRDSDDEDRKIIEAKIRRKVLRLRKTKGIHIAAGQAICEKIKRKSKIDPALEKLPPPPPPPTLPPSYLEQPIYLRPPTPTPLFYFHFDPLVHSMYVSQLERAIPPRLLNPKCVPPTGVTVTTTNNAATHSTLSPSHANSPSGVCVVGALNSNSKKDLSTLAAINRSSGRGEHTSSPKMMTSVHSSRPVDGSAAAAAAAAPLAQLNMAESAHKGVFPVAVSSQMTPLAAPLRQASPVGFVGMRIGNVVRLPPSPLTRHAAHSPVVSTIPVVGVRHQTYNVPPPTLMPLPPTAGLSPEPPTPQPTAYNTSVPPPNFNVHQRPALAGGYFMAQPAIPSSHPTQLANVAGDKEVNAALSQPSPQAMVAPFNVKRL